MYSPSYQIGKALRCAFVLMFGFFLAVFIFLVIHEDVGWQSFLDYLHPTLTSWQSRYSALGTGILQASMILGPGFGSIISLGSYNSFRSDSERLTVWVCITHVLVTFMAIICSHVANDHFERELRWEFNLNLLLIVLSSLAVHVGMDQVEKEHSMQFLYVAFSYLFGSFTLLPNLWSFLFFTVIFLAEMCALVSSENYFIFIPV